jgi:hypothetical protein
MHPKDQDAQARGRRRRVAQLAGIILIGAVAATIVLLVVRSGSSGKTRLAALVTNHQPDFTVSYPATYKPEPPLPNDRMVFLAEMRGSTGQLGQTLAVRRAAHTTSDLATDVRLLNDLDNFTHPGRRLLSRKHLDVRGAADAFAVDAEYPDQALGGVILRKVDLIVRTQRNDSYHLLLLGPADAVPDGLVADVLHGFQISGIPPSVTQAVGPSGVSTVPTRASTTPTNPGTAPTTGGVGSPADVVTLDLIPTSAVYVCLEDGTGRHLIDGRILSPGESIPPETASRLLLTLGNASVRMSVNGRPVILSQSSTGLGFDISPAGVRRLPVGKRPTCA